VSIGLCVCYICSSSTGEQGKGQLLKVLDSHQQHTDHSTQPSDKYGLGLWCGTFQALTISGRASQTLAAYRVGTVQVPGSGARPVHWMEMQCTQCWTNQRTGPWQQLPKLSNG